MPCVSAKQRLTVGSALYPVAFIGLVPYPHITVGVFHRQADGFFQFVGVKNPARLGAMSRVKTQTNLDILSLEVKDRLTFLQEVSQLRSSNPLYTSVCDIAPYRYLFPPSQQPYLRIDRLR